MRRHSQRSRFFASKGLGLVVVGLLIPLLVLSIFRGADVLIHGHQGELAHVHLSPLGIEGGAQMAAQAHDLAHGHSHDDDHGTSDHGPDDSPLGMQVTIQDYEQFPSREADLVPELASIDDCVVIAFWIPALLTVDDPGRPGGPLAMHGAANRPSARFGDRRARTSNAFLI